jgi:hypothetical protein
MVKSSLASRAKWSLLTGVVALVAGACGGESLTKEEAELVARGAWDVYKTEMTGSFLATDVFSAEDEMYGAVWVSSPLAEGEDCTMVEDIETGTLRILRFEGDVFAPASEFPMKDTWIDTVSTADVDGDGVPEVFLSGQCRGPANLNAYSLDSGGKWIPLGLGPADRKSVV